MNKKIILWLLLILWCGLIFFFSSQPAAESSALSSRITELVTNFIDGLKNLSIPAFSDFNFFDIKHLFGALETIIRKCAHFGVFCILGVISFLLADCYVKKRTHCILISLTFCVLYAVSDEFHQLFVPGRSGNPIDVGIDSLGALCGVLTASLFFKIIQKKLSD